MTITNDTPVTDNTLLDTIIAAMAIAGKQLTLPAAFTDPEQNTVYHLERCQLHVLPDKAGISCVKLPPSEVAPEMVVLFKPGDAAAWRPAHLILAAVQTSATQVQVFTALTTLELLDLIHRYSQERMPSLRWKYLYQEFASPKGDAFDLMLEYLLENPFNAR